MNHKRYRRGFTIVELIVVIVVIAILATITAVIYTQTQKQARDAKIRDGASKVADALGVWSASRNGNFPNGGSGSTQGVAGDNCQDGANGFFATGVYTCTIEDALVGAKLLPLGFSSSLPPNPNYGTTSAQNLSVMVYKCPNDRKAIVYYAMEDPTDADKANFNKVMTKCGLNVSDTIGPRDSWGMRNAILVEY